MFFWTSWQARLNRKISTQLVFSLWPTLRDISQPGWVIYCQHSRRYSPNSRLISFQEFHRFLTLIKTPWFLKKSGQLCSIGKDKPQVVSLNRQFNAKKSKKKVLAELRTTPRSLSS
jgi:hypothetical protein